MSTGSQQIVTRYIEVTPYLVTMKYMSNFILTGGFYRLAAAFWIIPFFVGFRQIKFFSYSDRTHSINFGLEECSKVSILIQYLKISYSLTLLEQKCFIKKLLAIQDPIIEIFLNADNGIQIDLPSEDASNDFKVQNFL